MDWVSLLKHYQEYDDIKDEQLLDESISTLENYFSVMDKEKLCNKNRPLAMAYLALKHSKSIL